MKIRSEAPLVALLSLGSALVYFLEPHLGEPRRWIVALAAAGFLFAPASEEPLRLGLWLPAVALVAWGGKWAGSGIGGLWLWLACSIAGAALAVRAGGRAVHYYVPAAGSEIGRGPRDAIRNELWIAAGLFLAVYLIDGYRWSRGAWLPIARAAFLFFSACAFMRYLLLQAKHLGVPVVPPLRPPEARGIVPTQRWPLLALLALVGGTRLSDALLARLGGSEAIGDLLLTAALLLVLAGIVFVLALVRLQQRSGWSKRLVRKTSFFAGVGLAVALAAVVAELEAPGARSYAIFTTACIVFLVMIPFVHSTTRLLSSYPKGSFLIAPPILSVMFAPVTAVNGERWGLASVGFLYAFAVLMVGYQLLVVVRERGRGRVYLIASLLCLVALFFSEGASWTASGGSWKIFLMSLAFVLYSVDLLDRAGSARS